VIRPNSGYDEVRLLSDKDYDLRRRGLMSIQEYLRLMLRPNEAIWKIRKRMPNVVSHKARAISSRTVVRRQQVVKKLYPNNPDGLRCFEREMHAHQLFANRPWMVPLLRRGNRWFAVPYYSNEHRLDRAAAAMAENERLNVARQAIHILFEIFLEGYAHCDFHAKNMYWVDGQLIVSDFETMQSYSGKTRPSFPMSYDLTGEGLESPFRTNRMCYAATQSESLQQVLGIPLEVLLKRFVSDLKQDVKDACKEFKARGRRHTCRAGRIYSSFRLPHFIVDKSEAQRDNARRLEVFGLDGETVRGRTVLDLGSNVGGVLFEIQKYQPGECVGIEYDTDKIEIARQIAAFNALHNVHFLGGNIDKLTADDTGGAFDIVLCLAIDGHIKKKQRLFRMLAEVTGEMLCFEGNSSSDREEIIQSLKKSGFKDIKFLGFCDDDCIDNNNCRPLFLAYR